MPLTASAMALMKAGVVPQHPPAIFSRPASANSASVAAQFVGQTRVGMGRDQGVGDPGDLLDKGPQRGGAQRAVQTENGRVGVPHGDPESLGGLAGKSAPAGVGDGAGNPDGEIVQAAPAQQVTDGGR